MLLKIFKPRSVFKVITPGVLIVIRTSHEARGNPVNPLSDWVTVVRYGLQFFPIFVKPKCTYDFLPRKLYYRIKLILSY